jgi:hypothetical protein
VPAGQKAHQLIAASDDRSTSPARITGQPNPPVAGADRPGHGRVGEGRWVKVWVRIDKPLGLFSTVSNLPGNGPILAHGTGFDSQFVLQPTVAAWIGPPLIDG